MARTLALKDKTSRATISRQFPTRCHLEHGTDKGLEVRGEHGPTKPPRVAQFGGIPRRWNRWVKISEAPTQPIWRGRSEVGERRLTDLGEVCGATDKSAGHHSRNLTDVERGGRAPQPP